MTFFVLSGMIIETFLRCKFSCNSTLFVVQFPVSRQLKNGIKICITVCAGCARDSELLNFAIFSTLFLTNGTVLNT